MLKCVFQENCRKLIVAMTKYLKILIEKIAQSKFDLFQKFCHSDNNLLIYNDVSIQVILYMKYLVFHFIKISKFFYLKYTKHCKNISPKYLIINSYFIQEKCHNEKNTSTSYKSPEGLTLRPKLLLYTYKKNALFHQMSHNS